MALTNDLPIGAIRSAAADQRVLDAVAALLAEADDRVGDGGWVCRNRGLCCDFDRWGHRLYVTTAELAYFVAGAGAEVAEPQGQQCPYHRDGVCTARQRRPVGCRLFFCDPASSDWQGREYERLRPALLEVHERLDLPYHYVEWIGALSGSGRRLIGSAVWILDVDSQWVGPLKFALDVRAGWADMDRPDGPGDAGTTGREQRCDARG